MITFSFSAKASNGSCQELWPFSGGYRNSNPELPLIRAVSSGSLKMAAAAILPRIIYLTLSSKFTLTWRLFPGRSTVRPFFLVQHTVYFFCSYLVGVAVLQSTACRYYSTGGCSLPFYSFQQFTGFFRKPDVAQPLTVHLLFRFNKYSAKMPISWPLSFNVGSFRCRTSSR